MYILGLDCGGTSSEALLATIDGLVIGRGHGGPANYTVNGVNGVVQSVLEAARGCLRQAGLDLSSLRKQGVVLALGISGAGREPEVADLKRAFQNAGFDHVVVGHDASIALLGALGGADGVVVIAGTGSIAYGLHNDRSRRAGGWGYLLGDEGSAFWIALRALQQVMWGYDGRARQDQALLEAVCNYFQVPEVAQLIPAIYKTPLNRGFVGGFSKEVAAFANQGHLLCQEILAEAGCQLGHLAVAALAQLGLLELDGRVGVCGGVFAAGDWVLKPMQREIQRTAPNQILTLPDFKPVVGAVLLAAKHCNLDMGRMVAKLKQTL